MGLKDRLVRKRLWRLHNSQSAAVERLSNQGVIVNSFDCVRRGDPRYRGSGRAAGCNRPIDQSHAGKRARRVMHKHETWRAGDKCFQPRTHGCLSRGATGDRREQVF
jgi:hypothetical protein